MWQFLYFSMKRKMSHKKGCFAREHVSYLSASLCIYVITCLCVYISYLSIHLYIYGTVFIFCLSHCLCVLLTSQICFYISLCLCVIICNCVYSFLYSSTLGSYSQLHCVLHQKRHDSRVRTSQCQVRSL